MVGLLQIRSTISAAATDLSEQLDEADLWPLKQWINELVSDVLMIPHELPDANALAHRKRALDHLAAILSA
jgi:hypothetical protein